MMAAAIDPTEHGLSNPRRDEIGLEMGRNKCLCHAALSYLSDLSYLLRRFYLSRLLILLYLSLK
jgi:hypothetical protein